MKIYFYLVYNMHICRERGRGGMRLSLGKSVEIQCTASLPSLTSDTSLLTDL